MPEQKDLKVFKQLNTKLQSATFRKSFSVDPLNALKSAKIDIEKIPEKELDVLAGLKPTELALLARISNDLEAAGDTNGYVVF